MTGSDSEETGESIDDSMSYDIDEEDLDDLRSQVIDHQLGEFIDNYHIETSDIVNLEKLARLSNTLRLIGGFSMPVLAIVVAITIPFTRTDPPILFTIQGINFPTTGVLFVILFSIPILSILLSRSFLRKAKAIEYSSSDFAHHKIASAITHFRSGEYEKALSNLSDRNVNRITLIRDFEYPGSTTPALTYGSDEKLDEYISSLEMTDDLAGAMERSFNEFTYRITNEIEAADVEELGEIIQTIDTPPESTVSYKSLIIDTFRPGPKWSRRFTRLIVLAGIGIIGFGVFHFVDDILGMLTTVALYSSYQILSG